MRENGVNYTEPLKGHQITNSKNLDPIQRDLFRLVGKPMNNVSNPINPGYCKHCGCGEIQYHNIMPGVDQVLCATCGSSLGVVGRWLS